MEVKVKKKDLKENQGINNTEAGEGQPSVEKTYESTEGKELNENVWTVSKQKWNNKKNGVITV